MAFVSQYEALGKDEKLMSYIKAMRWLHLITALIGFVLILTLFYQGRGIA